MSMSKFLKFPNINISISKPMSNVKISKGPISKVKISKYPNVKYKNLVYKGPINKHSLM